MSAVTVWNNCLEFIKDNIQLQAYKTWFEPIKPIKLEENILSVEVPSKFFYEWLEEHYIKILKSSLSKELGKDAKLVYIIKMENNFGSSKYNGQLNKVNQYKFSKLENFNQFNFEPLILDNGVIVFEKKGTIIRFNYNKKIVWKNNFYSKTEKKIHPTLSFAMTNKNLLVADSIAKISNIDLQNGDLIWSKKSEYPFNSEIKIYKDKFFIIDFSNTLRCFSLKNGQEIWNIKTDKSFIKSQKKLSLIIILETHKVIWPRLDN